MSLFKITGMKKVLFIFVIFMGVSCNKVLDKLPLDAPSSTVFPTTLSALQMALVGCNSPLTLRPDGLEVPWVMFLENCSDIATLRDRSPEQLWGDPNSSDVVEMWQMMYQVITRCNFLIANADRASENASQDTILNIVAQARFLRDFAYSVLSELYGGVPLITRPLTLAEADVPRSTKEQVVDFILSDLDTASNYLTITNQPNTMAITKEAAWALASRVALYNEKWQDCIDAAEKVMALEGTQVVLDSSYANLFTVAGRTSKEIIWAIQYNYDNITNETPLAYRSRNAHGYTNKIPDQQLVDSYECTDGLTIDKSPLYNPQDPFENRDPRLQETIAVPGSIYYGYEYETNRDSLYCWDYNTTPPTRISNLDATSPYASFSGYSWRKYTDPSEMAINSTNSEINPIVLRYAEVLLNYAEAKIEAGQLDQSVYDAINKVRLRSHMPIITPGQTQSQLRSIVRRERKVEFAGEGLRYFDIIRWGIAGQVLNGPIYGRIPTGFLASAPIIDSNGTPNYSNVSNYQDMRIIHVDAFKNPTNYLWPIPAIELQTNPKIVQNPGY